MYRILLVATLLLFPGMTCAKPDGDFPGFSPKLIIYLAKGAANACGLGCDSWIAVEGKVDQDAASRVRHFLQNVKDTRRPLYFYSPGGSVEQAFVIGRLLRKRKAVARVGRTVVPACGPGLQVDDACLRVKTGGGEVEAGIVTRNAVCNSACGYLFLGATTREIAPDAAMAVHNSRLTVKVRGYLPPRQLAAVTDRIMAKADRERAAFVASMGINREFIDLVRTVKFENPHMLTRPELFHFGIDPRPVAETAWTLEGTARRYVQKVVLAKRDDGQSFRTMEWRLFCENKEQPRLMFVREFDQGAAGTNSAVVMMAGPEKSLIFGKFPARAGAFEVWSEKVASDTMQAMLDASSLQVGIGGSMPAGKTDLATFDIGTDGLREAWAQLLTSCPAVPVNARPAIASPLTASPAR
jgi:hypothetical protein